MVNLPLLTRLTSFARSTVKSCTDATADGKLTLSEAWQLACEFGDGAVKLTELHKASLPGDQKLATVEAAFATLFDLAWPKVTALGGFWWLRLIPPAWIRGLLMLAVRGLINAAASRHS